MFHLLCVYEVGFQMPRLLYLVIVLLYYRDLLLLAPRMKCVSYMSIMMEKLGFADF